MLQIGEVLFVGGYDYNDNWLSTSEIYDPISATFSTNNDINEGREKHTASIFDDGNVLLVGEYSGIALKTIEIGTPPCMGDVATAVSPIIMNDSGNVELTWNDNAANSGGYAIHRNETPYFTPDDMTTLLKSLPARSDAYTDVESGIGSVDANHSYIVQARNCDASSTANSNEVGEFDFAIQPGTPDDLVALSDQFEDGLIDNSWTVFNASDFSQDEYGGQRHLIPLHKVFWYREKNGPFLYKLVDGDFKLTSRVRTNLSKPLDLSRPYQYAGIMMRDPSSDVTGLENYVFDVVGMHIANLAIETKSTLNDVSDPQQDTQWDDVNAELRICRLGSDFYLYKRHIGETIWTLARSFNRPNIGLTVQAGMIAYTQNDDPNLDAGFDYVEFSRVSSLGDCTTD